MTTTGTLHRVLNPSIHLLAVLICVTAAEAAAPSRPLSEIDAALSPLDRVAAWRSPAVDVERLRAEDEANRGVPGIPYRVGFPMATDLSPATSGTWEDLASGGAVWRLRVGTAGALWTVVGFDVFRLEPGAELRVFDPKLRTVLGPYSARDIRKHGQLWFPPVAGDELVIELFWPESLRGVEPALHLGTVSHGYKAFGVIGAGPEATEDFGTLGFGDSGACNIDVACPLGAAWQDEKRGVVILLSGGSGFCSGSLINTTADDCRPYALTAAHCGAGPSTTFGFNFERPGCGTGTPPPETNQTVTGATVLANYSSSDFTLLELDVVPPEAFDVYYNGWSRDPLPATESFCIHHPQGDAKKITHNFDPLVDGQNWGPNHWRVTQWEEGTTEPGSSGSPMFDQNHRIVGQLHGGTASCTSITYDEFGKVGASWTGGGTPSSRLSNWLDPDATGAIVVDGVDWATCAIQLAGTVELSRPLYACSDDLQISLRDDHLAGMASATVRVRSNTEASPETVTLLPVQPLSGRFAGSFPLEPVAPAGGDGVLSVAHGDTITLEYLDADDGMGGSNILVQATASVDCLPPSLSAVAASDVTGSSARITWTSDEPADSAVDHGPAPGGGTLVSSTQVVTQHEILLQGLAECSVHYFAVRSADLAGNTAIDDAAGAWYSFETGRNVVPSFASTDTPLGIPDNNSSGVTSTISVADARTVLDVDVELNVTHTYTGDLRIELVTPAAQTVTLVNRRGGGGNNFSGTLLDDEATTPISAGAAPFAGSFQPEQPLSAADGILAAGNWQLRVIDLAGSDLGTLDSWTLTLTYPGEACGPLASYAQHTLLDDTCATGGAGSGDGTWDPGEQVQFGLSIRNAGTGGLTGVVARLTPLSAGVTMIDADASFGDIAQGATAASADPHYAARLPGGLNCGDEVAFRVDVDSAEGSWTDQFAVVTGAVQAGGGVALDEDFDAGIPPAWTVADGGNDGFTWFADNASDPAGCANEDPLPPMSGTWAAVDSDCAGSTVSMDESLVTPALDLTGAWTAMLEFDHYFRRYQQEIADVDVRSASTGGAWVNVARYAATSANPQHVTLDLTAWAAGAPDVQVRFRYYSAVFEWYWYVDQVRVSYTAAGSCTTNTCLANPSAPAPVPALTADRVDAAGTQIRVGWDGACAPLYAKILYGPLEQVSSLTVAGARCAIANPELWDAVPAGNLWFLVVGDDGAGAESSWGAASGGERNGLSPSGTCGASVKDVSAICP